MDEIEFYALTLNTSSNTLVSVTDVYSWISYDESAWTIYGIPPNGTVDNITIIVNYTDSFSDPG